MILLVLSALSQNIHSERPAALELERVEARLFYKATGRLSDDLLSRAEPFVGWNTIIGEGGAEELADDVVVSARLRSTDGAQKIIEGPVELIVRNAKGKTLGRRVWRGVLTSRQGTVVLPLWMNDVGCAGELNITARLKESTKAGQIVLECGE